MKKILSKFFDMDGSINRIQFLIRTSIVYLLILIIYVFNEFVEVFVIELAKNGYIANWLPLYGIIMGIILISLVCSLVLLQLRRLNDLNSPRWLKFLIFVVPINVLLFLYLLVAKGQKTKTNSYHKEMFEQSDNNQDNQSNLSNERNPEIIEVNNNKSYKTKRKTLRYKKILIVVTIMLIVLGKIYMSLFYSPYNGKWQANLYNRLIVLDVKKDEGKLLIYHGSSDNTSVQDRYEILIFESNKKDTKVGIDGGSHKLSVNRGILVLELKNLYSNLGYLDEDVYFKKVKK